MSRTALYPARLLTLFGEPIKWFNTTRYLGLTLDRRLTWSPHIEQFIRRTAQIMVLLIPLLNRKCDLSIRNSLAVQAAHPPNDVLCVPGLKVRR